MVGISNCVHQTTTPQFQEHRYLLNHSSQARPLLGRDFLQKRGLVDDQDPTL